jgi:hypothetical protein
MRVKQAFGGGALSGVISGHYLCDGWDRQAGSIVRKS